MKKKLLAGIVLATLLFTGCGKDAIVTETPSVVESVSVEETVNETESEATQTETEVSEEKEDANVNNGEVEKVWLDASLPVEERVALLLKEMTLEEKAYQMVQPEQIQISLEEVTKYGVGSILSGGGSSPASGNSPEDWRNHVNKLVEASLKTRLGIPLIYGVDAVHGHNNVSGATVFPHNIGLGAADDEELMYEIAKVTAMEVKATGIQWDFSPCLGNPQDTTWGRTYECFSENTDVITRLSDDYIKGLQENGIVACAKHYIGEGYTEDGVNQGDVKMSDAEFDELLKSGVLDPYTGAVNAGVLTVMPSYSSVDGVKCHANYHLLTEVLKEELGFKGFVISDYNAIDQIKAPGLKAQVEISVNAGVDMLMEVAQWKETAEYIIQLVNEGKITQERLDDAVSRILYVKFVAGLFEEKDEELEAKLLEEFGSAEHREVARRAVRESLVLLKDENGALDKLKEASAITIEGEAAYNIGRQCGGWTITWQGQSGKITQGTTIIEGIYDAVKDHATVKHSIDGSFVEDTEAIVAVFGENPYAETDGDRTGNVTPTAKDIKMLEGLRKNLEEAKDIPTIAIIIAGRPIDISEYEDMFDAIIMAWLPGTEGEGIADVLFGDYEFTGKLQYTWPY